MVYLHQGSTKSALAGVSPISNRNIVLCYDLPTFLYGLDCIPINTTDLDRLEVKYRGVVRNMQSLPCSVATPAIYLSMGTLPVVAERHLDASCLGRRWSRLDRNKSSCVSDVVATRLL